MLNFTRITEALRHLVDNRLYCSLKTRRMLMTCSHAASVGPSVRQQKVKHGGLRQRARESAQIAAVTANFPASK